jgi:Flp pilus assembly protein TadG
MIMLLRRQPARSGVAAVEFAFIAPVVLFFILALVIGAFGVFRYQQVASLAREGARYASVRGSKFQSSTGQPAATPADVYNNVILPKSVALRPDRLTYSVTWGPDNKQGSTVEVRVTYQWIPEKYLGGITLSSTSRLPITY